MMLNTASGPRVRAELPQEHILQLEGARRFEQLALGIHDMLAVQGFGGLHSQPQEDLQQVVLHDVPDDAELVEVSSTAAGAKVFLEDDLNMLYAFVVPERLKELVPESQRHQVEHHLLAEVVVDPVQGLLREATGGCTIKLREARAVTSEGLLNDQPSKPAIWRASLFLHPGANRSEHLRVHGEEEHSIRFASSLQPPQEVVQLSVVFWVVVASDEVLTLLQEAVPVLTVDIYTLLREKGGQLHLRPCVPDNATGLRKQGCIWATEHQLV
mmetsp:Transcript_48938/g.140630  ORF Transcript_48938/g.140630 Transcript_48938/m.140630 type:complete len:270 (-) Transcript_48938:651-1460(-)